MRLSDIQKQIIRENDFVTLNDFYKYYASSASRMSCMERFLRFSLIKEVGNGKFQLTKKAKDLVK